MRALIVAHGQPSDPGPAAAVLRSLGERVAELMPGWQVGTATLAEAGELDAGVQGAGAGVIFPLFMAGGYFTRVAIPQRLQQAGVGAGVASGGGWRVLEPFGCHPALHDLVLTLARESGADRVLLAAHGSSKSAAPSRIAQHVAGRIVAETGLPATAAFIDQMPQIEAAQGHGPGSVCLPFFAMAGGHVETDVPKALALAGFSGRLLPPVGTDARVPALIAAALTAPRPLCDSICNWTRGPDIGNTS